MFTTKIKNLLLILIFSSSFLLLNTSLIQGHSNKEIEHKSGDLGVETIQQNSLKQSENTQNQNSGMETKNSEVKSHGYNQLLNQDKMVIRKIYKPVASSSGLVVDTTMNITGFTDHIMTIHQVNESLRLTISLTISQQSEYEFQGKLIRTDTNTIVDAEISRPYLRPQVDHVVTIDFNGYSIHSSAYNGAYQVNLTILKYNITNNNQLLPFYLLNETMIHTTSFYQANWFPPPAQINQEFQLNLVDLDANGKFDVAKLTGTINVNITDEYVISAWAYDNTTNSLRDDTRFTKQLYANNSNTINLIFFSWRLNVGSNESLYFVLQVKQFNKPNFIVFESNPLTFSYAGNISITSTPVLNFNDWDGDPLLSGIISNEVLVDQNNDSLIEAHELTTTLNMAWGVNELLSIGIENFNSFYVSIDYNLNDTGSYITGHGDFYILQKGNNSISFSTVGSVFSQLNGTNYYRYSLNINIPSYEWWEHVDSIGDYIRFQNGSIANFTKNDWQLLSAITGYNDFLSDTDNDGLANELVVEVLLNVGQTGIYRVNGEINEILTPCCMVGADTTFTINALGTQSIQLRFDGSRLIKQGWNKSLILNHIHLEFYDPVKNSWVQLYDKWSDSGSIYILNSYTLSQFDPIPAYFTGIFSHSYLETGNNPNLFDFVRIMVEVEVNEPGRYNLDSQLKTAKGTWLNSANIQVDLSTGTQTINLDFVASVFSQLPPGSIIFIDWLNIRQTDGTYSDSTANNPYSFSINDPGLFELPEATIQTVSLYQIDTDNNNSPNYAKFTAVITSQIAQNYHLEIELVTLSSNCQNSIGNEMKFYADPLFNLSILIFPQAIPYCQGSLSENMTIKNIRLYNEQWQVLDIVSDIPQLVFNFNSFDPPFLSNPYNITSTGVDTNANSLIDYLSVSFSINVSFAGNYSFEGSLTTINGDWRDSANVELYLSPGTHLVQLNFPYLYQYKDQNTSYKFNWLSTRVFIGGQWYRLMDFDQWTLNHVTTPFDYTDFDPPSAYFTDIYIEPELEGSGPNYKGLNIILNMTVSEQKEYQINYNLYSNSSGWSWGRSENIILQAGIHNVSLFIPGIDIKNVLSENIFIGSIWVQEQSAINKNDWITIYGIDHPSQPFIPANTYTSSQFSHPYGKIVQVLADYGEDTNNNGLFEYIIIPIQIQANSELDAWVAVSISSDSYSGPQMSKNYHIFAGLSTIYFKYSTVNFYKLNISNINLISYIEFHGAPSGQPGWDRIDTLSNVALSNVYILGQFDKPELDILNVTSYLEGRSNNSLYDNFVVEFDVFSSTLSGHFSINTYVNLDPSGCYITGSNIDFDLQVNKRKHIVWKISLQTLNSSDLNNCNPTKSGPLFITLHDFTVNQVDEFGYWNELYRYQVELSSSSFYFTQIDINQVTYSILSVMKENNYGNDNLYDGLAITLYITVNHPGAFQIELGLTTANLDWDRWRTWNVWLNNGTNTLTVGFKLNKQDLNSNGTDFILDNIVISKIMDKYGIVYNNRMINEHIYFNVGYLDPSQWTNDWYWDDQNGEILTVYLNGIEYTWNGSLQSVTFSFNENLNITVVVNTNNFFDTLLMQVALRDFSPFDNIFSLVPKSEGVYTTIITLQNDGTGKIVLEFFNKFGNYFEQFVNNIDVLPIPLPRLVDTNIFSDSGDFIQFRSFNVEVIIDPSDINYTLNFNDVFLELETPLMLESVLFGSITQNGSELILDAFNMSTNLYGDVKLNLVYPINGTNYRSFISLLFIAKDEIPVLSDLIYDSILYKNFPFSLSVKATDDYGIDKVLVRYVVNGVERVSTMVDTGMDTYTANLSINALKVEIFVEAYDFYNQMASLARNLNLLDEDPQAPKVLDYGYEPQSDTHVLGDQITFFVKLQKKDEVITSVSMVINSKSYAFEKTSEDSTTETWSLVYQFEFEGQNKFIITVLNSANKNQVLEIVVQVNAKEQATITSSPGFTSELLLFTVILVILARSRRIIKRND